MNWRLYSRSRFVSHPDQQTDFGLLSSLFSRFRLLAMQLMAEAPDEGEAAAAMMSDNEDPLVRKKWQGASVVELRSQGVTTGYIVRDRASAYTVTKRPEWVSDKDVTVIDVPKGVRAVYEELVETKNHILKVGPDDDPLQLEKTVALIDEYYERNRSQEDYLILTTSLASGLLAEMVPCSADIATSSSDAASDWLRSCVDALRKRFLQFWVSGDSVRYLLAVAYTGLIHPSTDRLLARGIPAPPMPGVIQMPMHELAHYLIDPSETGHAAIFAARGAARALRAEAKTLIRNARREPGIHSFYRETYLAQLNFRAAQAIYNEFDWVNNKSEHALGRIGITKEYTRRLWRETEEWRVAIAVVRARAIAHSQGKANPADPNQFFSHFRSVNAVHGEERARKLVDELTFLLICPTPLQVLASAFLDVDCETATRDSLHAVKQVVDQIEATLLSQVMFGEPNYLTWGYRLLSRISEMLGDEASARSYGERASEGYLQTRLAGFDLVELMRAMGAKAPPSS